MAPQQSIPTDGSDDDAPLDITAMARLMQEQQHRTRRAVDAATNWIILVWGIAWAVGFTAIWSGETTGGNPWFRIPDVVAAWTFGLLIVVAAITSATLGALTGRGQRGDQNTAGMMFGFAFGGATLAAMLLGGGLQRAGLPADTLMLMWPALFCFGVGVAYVAGAGIWRSWTQFCMGMVFLAACVIATWIGTPDHSLAYALCGVLMIVVFVLMQSGVVSLNGRGERSAS